MGDHKLSLKDFGIDFDAMDDTQKQAFSVRITNLLIDRFFEGDFSPELHERFLYWLADERNSEVKEAALQRHFDRLLDESCFEDDTPDEETGKETGKETSKAP